MRTINQRRAVVTPTPTLGAIPAHGRSLLPYRIHRAGYSDAEAVAQAQAAVGTPGNPVTGVDVTGTTLTVTFADGTNETHDLPAVSGVDNAAVQALIDAHAAMANIHHRPSSRVWRGKSVGC